MLDPSGIIENPLVPSGIIETPLVPSGSFGDWLVSPVLLANLANLGSKVQLCAARMGFLLAALLCLLLQPLPCMLAKLARAAAAWSELDSELELRRLVLR